jgi:hypothetical protein
MIPGYPEQLYKELSCELVRIEHRTDPEEKMLESLFSTSILYEQRLIQCLKHFQFFNQEEEICFFKQLRPKFGCLIHYYKKRYQAVLFRPGEPKRHTLFYEYELDKTEKFFMEHLEFYQYIKRMETDLDWKYFSRPWVEKNRMDLLLGEILGLEKYKAYIGGLLEKLKGN